MLPHILDLPRKRRNMATATLEELFGQKEEAPPATGLQALAIRYLQAREIRNTIKERLEEKQAEVDRLENELLVAMEQAGLKSIRLETGELCTAATKENYSLPPKGEPERRHSALMWLCRVGGKDLIEESIHYQSLNAFLRERAEAKKPISDLISTFKQKVLSVRKS